jgi:PEGA domain
VACLGTGSAVAAQVEPARVLLLAPSQDSAQWADIVRGIGSVGAHAAQVADLSIDPVWAACRTSDCAARAAEAAQLPTLLFTLQPTAAGTPARLRLAWFALDGRHATQQLPTASRSLSQVAAELFQRVRQQLTLGERALLRVHSVPVGAVVYLDGEAVGVTPLELVTDAGTHRVESVLDGFRSDARQITLLPGEPYALQLQLPRVLASTAAAPVAGPTRASPANFAIASALCLAALPALTASVNALVDRGQCLQSVGDDCVERGRFSGRSAVLLIGAALALGGAAYLVIAQPIRVEPEISQTGAAVHLRGRF